MVGLGTIRLLRMPGFHTEGREKSFLELGRNRGNGRRIRKIKEQVWKGKAGIFTRHKGQSEFSQSGNRATESCGARIVLSAISLQFPRPSHAAVYFRVCFFGGRKTD